MRVWFCGFAAGALLLALPWPWRPSALLQAGVTVLLVAVLARLVFARLGYALPGFATSGGAKIALPAPGRVALASAFGILLGLGWSALIHERALDRRVAPSGSRDAVPITIRVDSDVVPIATARDGELALRFIARIVAGPVGIVGEARRVRLSWYGAKPLRRGEVWRVAAALRPPWGYVNPAGFDQERWLFGQGIDGTGTIRRGTRIADAAPGWLDRTRERLGGFVIDRGLRFGPVLVAQLTGESGRIPAEQWDVFRVTGTIHLMVISGLHIALAAGFGAGIGRGLARLCPAMLLWLDVRMAGALCGVACGLAYFGLSGGGLPSLRACLMAAPLLLLTASGRRCQSESTLLVALAVVLALEPLAVHQQGFWLSFAAVGLLVVRYSRRYGRAPVWVALVDAQVLLSVCMAPMLVVLTGAIPLAGIAANLVAVPLVSFMVVPLTLLAGLLAGIWPGAAAGCLWLADQIFGLLYVFLAWCADVPQLHAEAPAALALAALVAGLVWLAGVPGPQQLLLLLSLSAVLLPRATGIEPGEFRVIGLDVGQGDAILVDTARHRLLFDAGPAYPGGFETGSAVVVPSLLATGPARLDALVLSHQDLDHVGGARAVERAFPVAARFASFPRAHAEPCDTASWTWDGVKFRFIDVPRSGPAGNAAGSNDGSCILLIENGRRRVLLAGDAGAVVEGRLLRKLVDGLDLMFAPHQGSATSSSAAFVRVMRPQRVFVSAGRDNRYGHPHPRVVERYRTIGADLLQTAELGALVWESAMPTAARGWRTGAVPYWRGAAAPPPGS